jgi:hypothetical protein
MLVPGDAAATVSNIVDNQGRFRIGVLSFIIMVIFDVVLTWALYILLAPVNKDLSLLAAWFRLVNCAIFGIALFNLPAALTLAGGAGYLGALGAEQRHALVMLQLDAFNDTWLVGLIFFGIHLLLLGYLIIRSGFIPVFVGVLLLAAGAGYLTDSFANFLLSNYEQYQSVFMLIVVVPGVVGELSFTVWLLAKGVKGLPQWESAAS